MSRIKGVYSAVDRYPSEGILVGDVRWLDAATGKTYRGEGESRSAGTAFKPNGDGTYHNGYYVFTPDAVPDSWYVLSLPASGYVRGPFPEAHARKVASQRAAAYSTSYAVVQLLPGNTAQFEPPAPPVPNVVWS